MAQITPYSFVKNTPIQLVDYMGLFSFKGWRTCCKAKKDKNNCKTGCRISGSGKRHKDVLGEVICFRGMKCRCIYDDHLKRDGWEIPIGSKIYDCLVAHEDYHFNDPSISHCPKCRSDFPDLIVPPGPKDPNKDIPSKKERECPAYAAGVKCMNQIPESERDRNWKCFMKSMRRKMEEYGCDNPPEALPDEPTDCVNN